MITVSPGMTLPLGTESPFTWKHRTLVPSLGDMPLLEITSETLNGPSEGISIQRSSTSTCPTVMGSTGSDVGSSLGSRSQVTSTNTK